MNKIGRFIITYPMKDFQSDKFIKWPFHITLLPWFYMPTHNMQPLRDFLTQISESCGEISCTTKDIAELGDERNIKARMILSDSLADFHDELMKGVLALGGIPESRNWWGENYLPHITFQGKSSVSADKIIHINKIVLVEAISEDPFLRRVISVNHIKEKL